MDGLTTSQKEVLPNRHLEKKESIFRMSQNELKGILKEHLENIGYFPTIENGFIYAAGTVPILLVAHLDTAHIFPVQIICYSPDGNVIMSPEGIGGDDRAGVYMILQIAQVVKCHILFCEDEERGCLGAQEFRRSGIRPEVNYIIELDRKGADDAVFYDCNNPNFRDFICSFGFNEVQGTSSDISIIAPYLNIAAVNLSAGYYHPHRRHEYIRVDQMKYNIERVLDIIKFPTIKFSYTPSIQNSSVEIRDW